MTESAYLYRAFGHVIEDDVAIMMDALPIIRTTPCGAWVSNPVSGGDRWVSTKGRKRFAYPTKEEAMESLIQRNKWRLVHLRNAVHKAEHIRDALNEGAGHSSKIQELTNGKYPLET